MASKSPYAKHHPHMKDVMGKYRLGSLFWEYRLSITEAGKNNNLYPIFTTNPAPRTVTDDSGHTVTYPSLKAIYMSYDHTPSNEYEFAMDVFGSWQHWQLICKSAMLSSMIASWREELALKIKCEAVRNIMNLAKNDSSLGLTASRYLADEGYVAKKVGRISKEEKERQIKLAAGVQDSLSEDMARLGLSVVNGGK